MPLTLSWDLFVIVFFAVVITYSFIIGKDESIKILVATYIGLVTAQAFGNVLEQLSGDEQSAATFFQIIGLTPNLNVIVVSKLLVFVLTIILLAIRGGFEVIYDRESSSITDVLLTGVFGFATGGLLLSALMTFAANAPLLEKNIATAPVLAPILQGSELLQVMVLYQEAWYFLPPLLLLVLGFLGNESRE